MKRETAEPLTFAIDWHVNSTRATPLTRIRAVNYLISHDILSLVRAYDLDRQLYDAVKDEESYAYRMRSMIYNMALQPSLRNVENVELVKMDEVQMRRGTLLESIERDVVQRRVHFENMLKETYDSLCTDAPATMACRKCKGSNLEFSQKQTRSCDEAMTIFTTCRDCGQRWKM